MHETRAGHGGVSGVETTEGTRKFVVDFRADCWPACPPMPRSSRSPRSSRGKIETSILSKIDGTDIWRLVLDVSAETDTTVELSAHVSGFGRKLTETWIYQWIVT